MQSLNIHPQITIVQDFVAAALGSHQGNIGVTALSSTGSYVGIVNEHGDILNSLIGRSLGRDGFGHTGYGRILYSHMNSFCQLHQCNQVIQCQQCQKDSGLVRMCNDHGMFSRTHAQWGKEVSSRYESDDPTVRRVLQEAASILNELIQALREQAISRWPQFITIVGSAGQALTPCISPFLEAYNLRLLPRSSEGVHFDGLFYIIKSRFR